MKIKATTIIYVPKDKNCAECHYFSHADNCGDVCYFFDKFIRNHKPCRPCLKYRKEANNDRK